MMLRSITQEIVVEKGGHDVIFKLHVHPGGNHLFIGGNQVPECSVLASLPDT